jgi:hypothetical protein
MVMYINNLLLNEGYYDNVSLGETNYKGDDLSELFIFSDDTNFTAGTVWQAPRTNWVYEGDVVVPSGAEAPIDPSGVYIDSVFYPKAHATHGHVFDFENGRVIFTSGTAPTVANTVQVEYTSKDVFIGIADRHTVHALHNDYFQNDDIFDSVFPSGAITTPAIWIDVEGQTISPLALGGGRIVNKLVHFHVISNDDSLDMIDDIADTLSYQQFKATRVVDIDAVPELFDFRGARSITYRDYTVMTADTSLYWNIAYWLKADRTDVYSERTDWNRIRMDVIFEVRGVNE